MRWQPAVKPKPLLLVRPRDAASLDEAHAAIELWEYYSGKTLDPDQKLAVELMMAETEDRYWAAPTTGRAKARQNGKGDEIEVVELWGLSERGEVILHTAHEDPTAKAAHERMVSLIDSHRDLRRLLPAKGGIRYANGSRCIELTSGAAAHYRTRTPSTGRGLDDISRLVVDEAQHAQPEQLASATNIVLANPNPQINFLGSAGIKNRSEQWWEMRLRAIAGDDDGFAYLEHSAERITFDADGAPEFIAPERVDDVKAWERANTAMASGRLTVPKLQQQLAINGPEMFARENLCVWDPPAKLLSGKAKIDPHWWRGCADLSGRIVGKIVVAVSTTYDLDRSALVIAGRRADGVRQVEVVQHDDGSHWLEVALLDVFDANDVAAVTFNAGGPAKALRKMLDRICEDRDIKLDPFGATGYQAACAAFVSDVEHRKVRHRSDNRLTNLAVSAPERRVGQGWHWDERIGDITPLEAATCAVVLADGLKLEVRRSAYEDADLITV